MICPKEFTHKFGLDSKMPNAHLFQGDFSQGLVEPIMQHSYDCIIATYSLHHLTDDRKVSFIQALTQLLNNTGLILIGDIAFENRNELEKCRKNAGEEWDDEEMYFVFDELQKSFPRMKFEQISYCAGVLTLLR